MDGGISSYKKTLFLVCGAAVAAGLITLCSAPSHTFPPSTKLTQLGVLQGGRGYPRVFQREKSGVTQVGETPALLLFPLLFHKQEDLSSCLVAEGLIHF